MCQPECFGADFNLARTMPIVLSMPCSLLPSPNPIPPPAQGCLGTSDIVFTCPSSWLLCPLNVQCSGYKSPSLLAILSRHILHTFLFLRPLKNILRVQSAIAHLHNLLNIFYFKLSFPLRSAYENKIPFLKLLPIYHLAFIFSPPRTLVSSAPCPVR